ncbi:MAG TPA: hypothetical protein DDZ43_09275, partial [Hyphomonadaceae bacterium]|nr:hypothetical protein [Hyphomonadaceae bacterium]
CTYCWREPHMDTLELTDQDPLDLLYESVRAQRRLLSGFGGNPKVPREKWLDAQNPKHVAISLNGEPTLYTRLSEYMELCHKHGMTTMLVTNGTLPKVLENLDTLPGKSEFQAAGLLDSALPVGFEMPRPTDEDNLDDGDAISVDDEENAEFHTDFLAEDDN